MKITPLLVTIVGLKPSEVLSFSTNYGVSVAMQFFNKLAIVGCVVAGMLVSFGCSPKPGELVVAKVGNKPILLKEYEELYLKSSGSLDQASASTQEERENFLDLMTKFKLKLADAYDQGLDKQPEIRSEINQYKGSLVASYLTEREVTAPGIKKLHEARQTEVRASHILLSLAPGAAPSDSEAVYKKAYELIALLNAGASFESLAVANSNDPSVNQNKGDLYFFTAGRMVPEFEEAVFALKVGELTQKPVRTQYGVHIIRCTGRQPASGEIKASHIMIRFNSQEPSPEDTLEAYKKISQIRDSLLARFDFAELATRNSEDPGSAPRGGDLGWFGRARWIQPFDEEAFKLKPGEISGIVRTIYGYHLIKSYEKRQTKPYAEAKKELQQVYQQTRFQPDYQKFLSKLKAETQFSMDETVLNLFVVSFDSLKTTRDSAWHSTLEPELGKRPLIRFGPRVVSCDSIVSIMILRPDMTSVPLNSHSLRQQVEKIAEQLVFQVKGETIEQTYPEFASIMKEYTDGILLYQIEQDRVWGKVTVNDTVLQSYFNANRDNFVWPDRVDFTSVSTYSDSLANLIHEKLKAGKTLEQIFSEDSARMKMPTSFRVSFAKGSAALTPSALKTLVAVAAELKNDAGLTLSLAAQPDTSKRKAQEEKLANQRLEAVKNQFTRKLGVDAERIQTWVRPLADHITDPTDKNRAVTTVSIDIINRRPWIVGGIDHQVQATRTDERTMKADSLAEGAYSEPFSYRGNFTIVRLNKKEPARQKTYEEAGTEVSSSFQEYESKRLEKEWLDGLRKKYPVVENKQALQNAFVRVQP